MSEKCFVCATPYQIIGAVSIAYNSDSKSDLYILPDFLNSEVYEYRIRELGLFSVVKLVDTSKYEAFRRRNNRLAYGLGLIHNYLRINTIVRSIVGNNSYKEIYISTHHNIGRWISIYFLKRGSEVVFFDDGEGSYDNPSIYKPSGIDRVVRTILFGKESIELSKKRVLYSPELFKKVFGESYCVSTLPNWSKSEALLSIINRVSGYTNKAAIQHRFVFLDTIPSEEFNESSCIVYERIVDICETKLGKELLIKKHPRDARESSHRCDTYCYQEIPFEVVCANSDIEDKVLISCGSTAVLTPKILFGSEPTVILLHRVLGENQRELMRDRFASLVGDMYHNRKRFLVPESIGEFSDIIDSLK